VKYRIVPERSRIRIEARATLHAVHAEGPLSGTLEADLDEPARGLSLEVTAEVAAIRSGDFLQDVKARSHVEADRHPIARFVLERASGGADRLGLAGRLEWRGRSVPLAVSARAEVGAAAARGQTSFELDMRSFGLTAPKLLFLKVGDVVQVEAEIVAEPI
jgi:YceI-like protein